MNKQYIGNDVWSLFFADTGLEVEMSEAQMMEIVEEFYELSEMYQNQEDEILELATELELKKEEIKILMEQLQEGAAD